MLACSYDAVRGRIAKRGSHNASFAAKSGAIDIASAICASNYSSDQEGKRFFGMPHDEFTKLVHSREVLWAPDGDAAFDDGGHVLQFDVEDKVRLIGFKCGEGIDGTVSEVSDKWIAADEFYRLLKEWIGAFEAEWKLLPKE